jgi:serine protease Do
MRLTLCLSSLIALLLVSAAGAETLAGLEEAFVAVAEKARPSVVVVLCEREVSCLPGISNLHLLDRKQSTAKYTLSSKAVQQKRQRSAASGFVIDEKGHIVTAASALSLGGAVFIKPPVGPRREAKVLGIDELANVALLQTEPTGLVPAPLGRDDDPRTGQWVVSVANPYGLPGSVSVGTVSGTNRYLESDWCSYFGLLQVTNPINPGEMGGALVDLSGKVVGMLSFSYEDPDRLGETKTNVNFAIPASRVLRSVRQILEFGEARYVWLGVVVAEAKDGSQGVVVLDAQKDSPASKSGLQPGDLILKVNGQPAEHPQQFQTMVMSLYPGDEVSLAVVRGEKSLSLSAALVQRPGSAASAQARRGGGDVGIGLHDLTSEMRQALGVSLNGGVLVGETVLGSPATKTGIRPGDVVVKVSGKEILSVRHYDSLLAQCGPGQEVEIEVYRDGVLIPLRVRLAPLPPGSQVSYVGAGSSSRFRPGRGVEEELFRLREQVESLQREIERLREGHGN